jgi:xylose dehydrogenase (NAD/NADP)
MSAAEYLDSVKVRDWERVDSGTLRIAMISLGWWMREQAIPAVADSKFCETTVLVSGSRDKVSAAAEEISTVEAALTYEEFTDGAATEEYDAVYVCTPNALHLPYAEAAAELGKAVLCEKPMESTRERAERLVAAAEEVPLMVAYRMQTDPQVRRMRELVGEGAIGDPVTVHGSMSQQMLETVSGDADQWRLDPDLVGYGASVTDLGIYPLNTARFVLNADPVSVTAQMRSTDEAFDNVPDQHAAFTVRFDDETQAAFTASQHAADAGHLRVVGTDGELTLDPTFLGQPEQTLTLVSGGRRFEVADGRRDVMRDEMTEEFDYFADRVLRGAPIHPDGDHALIDMRALEAIYEAAETGTAVSV